MRELFRQIFAYERIHHQALNTLNRYLTIVKNIRRFTCPRANRTKTWADDNLQRLFILMLAFMLVFISACLIKRDFVTVIEQIYRFFIVVFCQILRKNINLLAF